MANAARRISLAATVLMATVFPAFAGEPALVLQVDNGRRTTTSLLKAAQAVASEVFAAAGVEVGWADTPAVEIPRALRVIVVLVAGDAERQVVAETGARASVLGFAPLQSRRVYIFLDRVAELARLRDRSVHQVLGRAIAHEVGHQLLPEKGHSRSGIMRSTIDDGLETPRFTTEQTQSIHALLAAERYAGLDAGASSLN